MSKLIYEVSNARPDITPNFLRATKVRRALHSLP